ncbi:MAG: SufE family protein [Gemmatimonadetes bacterium]|nr:SufE family protein [Gemmatimonadota bacterium]MDE2678268.1 SufE family protein [Gemmatimonadota bacterium]MXX35520.1 SufE family protein [Gemmatimonadota bacterium]MYA11549.1 SufE family protein [Gemmatimonadota bacterium]MYD13043.1 SufE family protein [Gemmatimonadota bacterium]
MTIEQLEKRLNALADRTLRYHYIIQLGRRLPPMDPELKTDETQVRGCMSPAWLAGWLEDGEPPTLRFVGDSESIIVKGLFAILAEVYNGQPPDDALAVDLSDIFERLKLGEALSPNRRNGFYSMVEKIRRVAASLA